MKKSISDIDKLTKELLSKSLLKPASSDFDDKLMNKILLAPSPARLNSNRNNTRKAWIFWIIAVVFFLISVLIMATFSGGYYNDVSNLFKLTFTYVSYGGMALFIPLVLYHFDALIQLMYWEKGKKISMI